MARQEKSEVNAFVGQSHPPYEDKARVMRMVEERRTHLFSVIVVHEYGSIENVWVSTGLRRSAAFTPYELRNALSRIIDEQNAREGK